MIDIENKTISDEVMEWDLFYKLYKSFRSRNNTISNVYLYRNIISNCPENMPLLYTVKNGRFVSVLGFRVIKNVYLENNTFYSVNYKPTKTKWYQKLWKKLKLKLSE